VIEIGSCHQVENNLALSAMGCQECFHCSIGSNDEPVGSYGSTNNINSQVSDWDT